MLVNLSPVRINPWPCPLRGSSLLQPIEPDPRSASACSFPRATPTLIVQTFQKLVCCNPLAWG